MGPKKKGKAEEQATPKAGGTFTEVEKTFLELQVAELNRKVARLRTAVDEYEVRNEELQKAYDQLDEDRADIIAYLKKTLNLKNEENNELKEKVRGLEETREIETAQFKETVTELERNFTTMKDQLTSENKLLAGKLNTLEEFRAIRDDLMKKFEKQEQAFKDQEMRYKRIIYDAEKKFVIGKDKLKKEMESRLLQLAQDFQDATELRIAASTHRVIRENIAINNELDSILQTQAKLSDQNEKYKESEKAARAAKELAEEERDKAINKNVVQLKVIDQLTATFQEIKKQKALYEKKSFDFENLQIKIQKLTSDNEKLSLQNRILEQNLHARLSDQSKSQIASSLVAKECAKLRKILKEAAISVRAALKLDDWAIKDPTRELMDRQILLTNLLDILTKYREMERTESTESIASLGKVYEEGDLGFIPKIVKRKSILSPVTSDETKRSRETSLKHEKESSVSISSLSLGSVKTIPSIKLIPPSTEEPLPAKDSLPSFVTSTKSSVSSTESGTDEVSESEMNMEQKLEQSKLEIQKSILKDLQMTMQSQTKLSSDKKISSKSVIIEEEEGDSADEHVESEHPESEHLESEHIESEQLESGHEEEENKSMVEDEELKKHPDIETAMSEHQEDEKPEDT